MRTQLTEKQQTFLNVLFDEAQGNLVKAKKLAGYSDNVATSSLAASLQEEIAEETKKFISSSATKAAHSMFEVMSSPTDLGNKEKMAAAKDILDRSGFTKTDKVEVTSASPLFILPEKKNENK